MTVEITTTDRSVVTYDDHCGCAEISYLDGQGEPRPNVSFKLHFQDGPTGGVLEGINGLMNEEVIELLVLRLRALNRAMPCRENAFAITKLQEALLWLNYRQQLRMAQGVYGTDRAHDS